MKWTLVLLGLAIGCAASFYHGMYRSVTSYNIQPVTRTPGGIHVDRSGNNIDLDDLDKKTAQVETCLAKNFPDGRLSPEVQSASHCIRPTFDPFFHRDAAYVKIAPDWHVGCEGEQVFPCNVDPKLCEAKGFVPTKQCPCECRSTIQNDNVVVTTPNLYLYKGELIRLMTGCNNIWTTQKLASCFTAED